MSDNERKKRLFVSNFEDEKWNRVFDVDRVLKKPVEEQTVKEGIILPLRVREDIRTLDEAYEGGVCNADGSFVAGLRRDYVRENANISVCKSYEVEPDQLQHIHETVVFGGILQEQFGDMLTMSTTRLWWFARNPDTEYKFVFLHRPGASTYPDSFFNLIGLTPDRMLILTEPTQFDSVIVPDEACYILTRASYQWLEPFDLAKEIVSKTLTPPEAKKIYLSRSHLAKYGSGDGVNEEYYENFYEKRGFLVLHPQELPLAEQINYLMNADEIVCTFGTLSHMALFARSGVKHTSILRSPELWIHQAVVNAVRELDWYWVEGTRNPLTTSHDFGYFLYYPTVYFKQYLESTGTEYAPEEFLPENPSDDLIIQYIKGWTKHFSNPLFFKRISEKTALDELSSLYGVFYGEALDLEEYNANTLQLQRDKIKELQDKMYTQLREKEKEYADLAKEKHQLVLELKKTRKRLEDIENSSSWKATKPLRSTLEKVKGLRK